MLDQSIKDQLTPYLALLESDIVFSASLSDDEHSGKIRDFLTEVAALSPRLSVREEKLNRTPSFRIDRPDQPSGVVFAALPLGHELTSFVLALLQVSGRAPKVDEAVLNQIRSISSKHHFETYISLSCHICPDIVQALNIMSVVNPNITHDTVDGGIFRDEITDKDIMAVPTVYMNGEEWVAGRTTLEDMVEKLTGSSDDELNVPDEPYDVLVIGGGPAGVSAAIYAVRKGIRTALVTPQVGGQILETVGISNVIGTSHIEGTQLASSYATHLADYPIDQYTGHQVANVKQTVDGFEIELEKGAVLKSRTVIAATGARWRPVNVPGEEEFKNKGVAYCPHCDGPLYEGKDVAVIGGGNSGVEAALDLSHIAKAVTVIEFLPTLKADQVLQEKLYSTKNVTVVTNAATTEIHGDKRVNAISFDDRDSGESTKLDIDGVFVQIGLVPDTQWLDLPVTKTRSGEIVVDAHGQSTIPGFFAAGDCTNSAYKQIVIATGAGATAALGAFDYLIREGHI